MYTSGQILFDWDDANMRHIARHRVSPSEAEQVVKNDPLDLGDQIRGGEERLLQIGHTDAFRILVVVTTWRGELLRVITAYPAPASLRAYFIEGKTGQTS